MPKIKANIPKYVALVALLIYYASLVSPAFFFEHLEAMTGFDVLKIGWMGILLLDPRWYANLIFWVSVLCLFGETRLRVASMTGVILVLASLFLPIYYFPNENQGVPVTSLGLGVYLWSLSLLSVFTLHFFPNRKLAERAKG